MQITNIKQLAHYIAACNQQDKRNKYNINIWKYSDFSEDDKKSIAATEQELKALFTSYAYARITNKEYQSLLDKIKNIASHYFFGFIVQDKILELCNITITSDAEV